MLYFARVQCSSYWSVKKQGKWKESRVLLVLVHTFTALLICNGYNICSLRCIFILRAVGTLQRLSVFEPHIFTTSNSVLGVHTFQYSLCGDMGVFMNVSLNFAHWDRKKSQMLYWWEKMFVSRLFNSFSYYRSYLRYSIASLNCCSTRCSVCVDVKERSIGRKVVLYSLRESMEKIVHGTVYLCYLFLFFTCKTTVFRTFIARECWLSEANCADPKETVVNEQHTNSY